MLQCWTTQGRQHRADDPSPNSTASSAPSYSSNGTCEQQIDLTSMHRQAGGLTCAVRAGWSRSCWPGPLSHAFETCRGSHPSARPAFERATKKRLLDQIRSSTTSEIPRSKESWSRDDSSIVRRADDDVFKESVLFIHSPRGHDERQPKTTIISAPPDVEISSGTIRRTVNIQDSWGWWLGGPRPGVGRKIVRFYSDM
jgi:hypothetical protein